MSISIVESSRKPRNRKLSPTEERRARARRIQELSVEMVDFKCKRCVAKELRCFVDTASGHCAGCIAVNAECSLFVSEGEWERVAQEKREKELRVAELEAELALSRVELLRVKNREQEFARRDLAILAVQDKMEDKELGQRPSS